MTFLEIEQIFNRSIKCAFAKKKLLIVFPILVVCGLLIVFCRALAFDAGKWLVLSLTFMPIFLCSGLLLALGVLLARVHFSEVKEIEVNYKKILKDSWELLIGVSYLSLPPLLAYLLLWTMMGVFYLLKEIPAVGEVIGVILAFGPFLLVLGSLVLSLVNLFILFFVTPHVALRSNVRLKLAEDVYQRLSHNVFSNAVLLIIGLIPLAVVVGLLSLAAVMTGLNFALPSPTSLTVSLQWFFIMIPFCGLLTPSLIFFFNFACESHLLMANKEQRSEEMKELSQVL